MIRRRLLTGTASNYVGKFVSVGTWLVLTPFVLARLGDAAFALWVLMGAIASYGFLLDFGIGGAVVKYVAEQTARGDRTAARSFVASAAWLYLGLAAIAVGIGFAAAPVLPGLFGVAADQQSTAARLVLLTALNVALTIAFTPSFAILKGLQRYDLYNAIVVAAYLGEAVAVVAVLLAGAGVLGMVAVLVPVNFATGIACSRVVRHIAPDLAVTWRGAEWRLTRRIASFSTSLFAIDIATRLQTKSDEFVIVALRMLPLVTPYALARKLGELAQLICVPFLKVVMPLASALEANDEGVKLRTLYIVSSRIALGVAVPITLGLTLLGGPILTLWVGAAYAPHAPVLTVLALASLIATSQWPAVEILQGMARHRLVALTSLAAGIANVALSVVLLPRVGLIGVALGTLIPAAVAWLGIVLPFALRTLRVSPLVALREVWAPALVPGAGAALVLWSIAGAAVAPSALTLFGSLACAGVVYAAGYLLMPAAVPERRLLADVLAVGTRRLKHLRTEVSEA
jgi:O-antigen/teichoic acid export membrane protein